jgi:DNA polymerase IV (DinB-like DNA polymerase)
MALVKRGNTVEKKESLLQEFIFHIDLDCFFASVELRERPALRGFPVVVGGNKETKKGVVLTCTYEAREFGIHSGMSILQAVQLCPDIICVGTSRGLYKQISDNIMTILQSYTDEFRQASIDEAYLNLTSVVINDYNGNPLPLAQKIKDQIFEAEEITCSIGIGPNTTIAKMATSQNKPNGITFVPKERRKDFLQPLLVSRISGIGPKTATWLQEKHDITTIGQIMALETEYEMIRKFNSLGKFFYKIISGKGRTSIRPRDNYAAKSISNGRTFYGRKENGQVITPEKILNKMIDRVHKRLIDKKFRYKTITLEVKLQENLKIVSKSKSFLAANDDKERITTTAFELLEEFKRLKQPIRKIAVRLSNFEKFDPKQKTMTDYFCE